MHYTSRKRITLGVAVIAALALLVPGQAQACNYVCDGPNCGFNSNGGFCEERPFGCIEYICFANASEQEKVHEALKVALDSLGDSPMAEEIVKTLTPFPGARVIGLDGEVVFEGPQALDRSGSSTEIAAACGSASDSEQNAETESAAD